MLLPSKTYRRPALSAFQRISVSAFAVSAASVLAQESPITQEPSAPPPTPVSPAVNSAQFAPAPVGGYPGMTPGQAIGGTSQIGVSTPVSGLPTFGQGVFAWGIAHFAPHLVYQVSYGNSLQPIPGQHANTVINSVSPGLLIRLGDHWSLDYTPTLRFYSSHQFQDGTDHTVSLHGSTTYQDWSFAFSQGYSVSSQPLIETGAQTDQETFDTSLSAVYQLNSKVSLNFGVNQDFRFISQNVHSALLTDLHTWSTMEGINYQIEPSLSVGLSAGFTYNNLAVGPDVTSESYQARLLWHPGKRLSLSLSGGLSDQQFLNSKTPDFISPTYSAAIQYQLFETTSLSLSANRGVTPSYFQTQVTDSTSVSAGIHQRLLQHFFLDLTGGYGSTSFHGTTTGPALAGIGNYESTSFSASLSTLFLKRASASIFYQLAFNSSGASLYNYTTTQVGLTLGYHF